MINSNKKIILIIIFIPLIVALLMEGKFIWEVQIHNDWIGFYASYFGSIIGVIGVFEVMKSDQRMRSEERKNELFLNNLSTYIKISSLTNLYNISEIEDRIKEIKVQDNWIMIDNSTKKKMNYIEGNLKYSNENSGLNYAIKNFARNNLFNELKTPNYFFGNEENEPTEFEDLRDEMLDEMTCVIKYSFNYKLIQENNEIFISKKTFSEILKRSENITYNENDLDIIFQRVSKIKESKEWLNYITKRKKIFDEIKDIKSYVDSRTNSLLDY